MVPMVLTGSDGSRPDFSLETAPKREKEHTRTHNWEKRNRKVSFQMIEEREIEKISFPM
jgi:hypothetical protein